MSQIFKKQEIVELLFSVLDEYSIKNEKYYLVDDILFKKLKFDNKLNIFLENLKPYYFDSKSFT